MPTPHVLYERDQAVAFVTINRPEGRNAMTWEMYQALIDYCDAVERDPTVRVLVLKGAGGKAFIAGTDIAEFQAFESPEDGIEYERRLDAVIDRIEAVGTPTIAQVEGVATGGGCAIVAACDLRVCTPASRFGVPIARTLGNCLSVANHCALPGLDRTDPAQGSPLHRAPPRRGGSPGWRLGHPRRRPRRDRPGGARPRHHHRGESTAHDQGDQGDDSTDSGPSAP